MQGQPQVSTANAAGLNVYPNGGSPQRHSSINANVRTNDNAQADIITNPLTRFGFPQRPQ